MRESKAKQHVETPVFRGEPITVREAMKRYRIGKNWMYRHMKAGTLPFPWHPYSERRRFFDTADIEDWINMKKIPAGTRPGDIKGGRMKM